jgi:hypothetical protein
MCHANLLSKYFQIKETNHQTNPNFSLHKPFSFVFAKQEDEEEGLSSVFTLPKHYILIATMRQKPPSYHITQRSNKHQEMHTSSS